MTTELTDEQPPPPRRKLVQGLQQELRAAVLSNVFGGLFLFVAVVGLFHTASFGWPSLIGWKPDVAAGVMSGAGTVAVIFFGFGTWFGSRVSQRSKSYLDLAIDGIRRAYDVLELDQPSRNIAWVNAARLIRRAEKVAGNIVEADHADAWKLFREEWRIRLGKFLNADLGYYFGVDALKPAPTEIHVTEKLIQDLAKRSFKPTTLSIDGLESFDDENSMIGARRALKVIVDFVRLYDTTDEALDGVTAITDDDREKLLWSGHRGFRAYLDTLESYSFVEGKATKRKQSAG